MSIIGNPIMAGVSGPYASIFVTGLNETDTVTAVHKKTVQVPNPNYIGLPDGYTQLEYIESTGTQYIDTGVIPNTNSGYEFDVTINSPFSSSDSISTGSIIGCYTTSDKSFGVSVFTKRFETGDVAFGSGRYAAHLVVGSRMQISLRNHIYTTSTGGTEVIGDSLSATISAFLFASNDTSVSGNAWGMAKAIMYSAKMYDGGTIIRNYIPAKRISDSAIGLYDLVNNVFYTNAGTGTFTAGSEIPAYIEMTVDDKTLTGKWTQKPNPAYVTLPDGYTQLEYIELSGSQAIFLGDDLPSRAKVSAKVMAYKTSGSYCIFSYLKGSQTSRGTYISTYNGNWYMDINNTEYYSVSYSANTLYEVSCDARTDTAKFYVDGVETYSTTPRENINTRITLGANGRDSALKDYFNGRIYRAEYEDYSGTVVKTLIPAKRNSDDVIGMYDIVNDVFYTNAGTGTFTAGPEVPQTVDGFLIKPIRDLGTWTVTATDGVHTKTQDVLVDVITEYEIELSYVLWLYRNGDERESVTGGWNERYVYDSGYTGTHTCTKNNDNIELYLYQYGSNMIVTSNKIQANGTLKVKYDAWPTAGASDNSLVVGFGIFASLPNNQVEFRNGYTAQNYESSVTDKIASIDVSTDGYVAIGIDSGSSLTKMNIRIKEVWIE